ncbi:MAG: long-chain fatty acid--CoA ligase [Desulfarculus sp.]|nr:MAG: long-chain fatty acid--CoA ligase [Desulfarculus sp.]
MLVNMGRVFRQHVQRFPERAALVNVERGRRFTYAQMHLLSNQVSNLLAGRFGLGEGDFYATILENDNMGLFHPWMLKCPVGAVWIDIREFLGQKLVQLDYVQPRLVFLEAHFLPQLYQPLRERGMAMVCMDHPGPEFPGVHDFWRLVEQASPAEAAAEFVADDAARHISVLRFTGGTTGQAKCAMYTLSNLWTWGCNPAHYIEAFPYDHPRALLFSPLNHAASGSVVIPIHIKGGAVVTLNKADLEQIGQVMAAEKIQMIYTVPTVAYRMLDAKLHQRYDLSSLKTIRYGAAPISPAKLEALVEAFGPIFVHGYGSTECWPSCTILGRAEHSLELPEQIQRLSSIGRPFPGQELIICDEQGREMPVGERGELWIRGANTIQGYYRDPELTRQNFSAGGFWKSGDIGYVDGQGYVYLVDRKKDMIISGGYNVYATEVENCLNSHPAVQNSAVVGLPDEQWGEAVCAVVVLNEGQRAQAAELIAYCKENLARYKAPKKLEIVSELPLSPAGKVLRRRVRERLLGSGQGSN